MVHHEDEHVIVFDAEQPRAQVHFIVLAKTLEIHSMVDVSERDEAMLGHMLVVAAQVAHDLNLD